MNQPIKVEGSGPDDATVMIVGEAPGQNEEQRGFPFCGASGLELNRLLAEVGFTRTDLRLTNVCKYRPPGNQIDNFFYNKTQAKKNKVSEYMNRYPAPEIHEGIAELHREISRIRPNIIIAFGNTALWALTGEQGIGKWRGSMLQYIREPSIRVLPTYHPAAVLRMWKWRPIVKHDLMRAFMHRDQPWPDPDYDFTIATDIDIATTYLNHLLTEAGRREWLPLSVDIETRAGHIACIGIAWNEREALCIPFLSLDSPQGFWDVEKEYEIVSLLRQLLLHPTVEVFGQNFLYDDQYLAKYWGFVPYVRLDTMLAQHVLIPGDMPKGLDFLSSMYCRYHRYWKDEGKEWDKSLDEQMLWEYNCKDAVVTYECAAVLLESVEKAGLSKQLGFLMDMFPRVLRTMLRGVRRDHKRQGQLALELMEKMGEYEAWFNRILPEGLLPPAKTPWYNSNPQIQKLFYTALGFRPILHPKRKRPTCDDDALRKLAKREPAIKPLCDNLLKYRQLRVFYGTFVGARADRDGRFRSSYNIGGTETFRFSSSKDAFGTGLNLQNLPKGDDHD